MKSQYLNTVRKNKIGRMDLETNRAKTSLKDKRHVGTLVMPWCWRTLGWHMGIKSYD